MLAPQRALNPRKGPVHRTPTLTAAPPPQLTSLIHSQRQGELWELNRCATARRVPDLGKLHCISQPHASFDEPFDVVQLAYYFLNINKPKFKKNTGYVDSSMYVHAQSFSCV